MLMPRFLNCQERSGSLGHTLYHVSRFLCKRADRWLPVTLWTVQRF
jgi:hypothetical protein